MNLRLGATYRLTLAALAAMVLTACASHPPPPPAPVPPPPQSSDEGPPPQGYQSAPTQQTSAGPLPGTVQDFVVNVGELVYFDFDGSNIRPDAQPVLAGQAQWLQRYPQVRVRIEGNCDERGTREYNFALGARRADAVRSFLIAHGVAAARITTISYGKERPIDPGHDDQAWARNRNAHTAITEGAR
ncbi:MAG TPA: peptidoglycan-associated lipoprotein Pal [Caulobacteraceae bacterium]|jgi:peptidoglycan-associated lipoprotein|nr:peptidoglycan-associated lipoprotein Pal [Caulobacteraceae bacterium]